MSFLDGIKLKLKRRKLLKDRERWEQK